MSVELDPKTAKLLDDTEALIELLHEVMHGKQPIMHAFLRNAVDEHFDRLAHPEDYAEADYGQEDEETGVFQLPAPFCRLDDERGAA